MYGMPTRVRELYLQISPRTAARAFDDRSRSGPGDLRVRARREGHERQARAPVRRLHAAYGVAGIRPEGSRQSGQYLRVRLVRGELPHGAMRHVQRVVHLGEGGCRICAARPATRSFPKKRRVCAWSRTPSVPTSVRLPRKKRSCEVSTPLHPGRGRETRLSRRGCSTTREKGASTMEARVAFGNQARTYRLNKGPNRDGEMVGFGTEVGNQRRRWGRGHILLRTRLSRRRRSWVRVLRLPAGGDGEPSGWRHPRPPTLCTCRHRRCTKRSPCIVFRRGRRITALQHPPLAGCTCGRLVGHLHDREPRIARTGHRSRGAGSP